MQMWTEAPDIAMAATRTFEREGAKYAYVVTVGIPGYLPESAESYETWEDAANALEQHIRLTRDMVHIPLDPDMQDIEEELDETAQAEIDGIWGVADDSEVSVDFGGYVHELHIVHHSDI